MELELDMAPRGVFYGLWCVGAWTMPGRPPADYRRPKAALVIRNYTRQAVASTTQLRTFRERLECRKGKRWGAKILRHRRHEDCRLELITTSTLCLSRWWATVEARRDGGV